MRIALYGGSFNPIHHGHLIIARAVAEILDIDRVILLPSRMPPHKHAPDLAPGDHRATMVQAAIAGDPLFEASDHDLTCEGPSYTANTVAAFRQKLAPKDELIWILGADSLLELHLWRQPADIARQCRIVTAVRPGFEVGDLADLKAAVGTDITEQLRRDIVKTPRIDISATDIRERVRTGRAIRYLVPEAVAAYIHQHGLYTA